MVDETKLILNSSDWVEKHTFKEANFMVYNVDKWVLLLTFEGMVPSLPYQIFALGLIPSLCNFFFFFQWNIHVHLAFLINK